MNRKIDLILPLLLLLLSFQSTSFAQDAEEPSLRQLDREGEKAVDDADWEKAKEIYKKLLKSDPNSNDYNFYMGLAYFKSEIDKEKSIPFFENVNATQIPQKDYFLGQAYHYDSQFQKAIASYEVIIPLALDNKKGEQFKAEVERFVEFSKNGIKYQGKLNDKLRVENLGDGVNTQKREYAPVVFHDLKVITFAAAQATEGQITDLDEGAKANEDIWFASYINLDDAWDARQMPDGKTLSKKVNTEMNESPISYNTNNKKFVLYRQGDLYESVDTAAPTALNVDKKDLTADDITAIYQSADGNTRFVVTDFFEGVGGLDIYISKKEGDSWTPWANMEGINTPYDEDSPYIGPDGNFYFSSQGHDAMGGHDIFKATKSGDSWSTPVNMGMPINSPANDIHFSMVDKSGETVYLASDRKGTTGSFDIYRVWTCLDVPNTNINGVLLASGSPLEKATLYLRDADSNKLETIQTNAKGEYSLKVQPGNAYIVEVAANNYLNEYFAFTVPVQCKEYDLYQELAIDMKENKDGVPVAQASSMQNAFYEIDRYREDQTPAAFIAGLPDDHRLKPTKETNEIAIESPILLAAGQFKDVRFGFDSDEVAGTADAILENVASYMNKFEEVTIVLNGHTDTKGPSWYNKALSKRRANSVSKVLQAKGVDKSKITIKYFGEEQPLVADYDEAGNYLEDQAEKNRRVEIEVIIPEETTTEE